jgi:hypothetical protein
VSLARSRIPFFYEVHLLGLRRLISCTCTCMAAMITALTRCCSVHAGRTALLRVPADREEIFLWLEPMRRDLHAVWRIESTFRSAVSAYGSIRWSVVVLMINWISHNQVELINRSTM